MRRTLLDVFAAVSLTFAAALTSVTGAHAGNLMVMKAFARASTTPTAETGAAYVTLMNHSKESDTLVSVTTPVAAKASIDKTELLDGVMKMSPAGELEVPAMGTLEMKPGGYHIMMMGLKQPLKKGEEIEVTLRFTKAGDVTVKVPVGGVAANGGN